MIIAITETDSEGNRNLVGRFDHRTAQCFNSDRNHDRLYRTARGRWVLYTCINAQAHGQTGDHCYIDDEKAREWLQHNGHADALRPPGRPEIGGKIAVAVGSSRLTAVSAWAQEHGIGRGEAIRQLLDMALDRAASPANP